MTNFMINITVSSNIILIRYIK